MNKDQNYLTINYMKSYTDLRTAKMDFHEFMNLINLVYDYGYKRGTVHGIEQCQAFLTQQEE